MKYLIILVWSSACCWPPADRASHWLIHRQTCRPQKRKRRKPKSQRPGPSPRPVCTGTLAILLWRLVQLLRSHGNPPAGASIYKFKWFPEGQPAPTRIGADADPPDGVAVAWTVSENLSWALDAEARFLNGNIIHPTSALLVYSSPAPPDQICSRRAGTIAGLTSIHSPANRTPASAGDPRPQCKGLWPCRERQAPDRCQPGAARRKRGAADGSRLGERTTGAGMAWHLRGDPAA